MARSRTCARVSCHRGMRAGTCIPSTLSKPTLDALQAPQGADKSRSPATRTEICATDGNKENAVCLWGISRERSYCLVRCGVLQVTGQDPGDAVGQRTHPCRPKVDGVGTANHLQPPNNF